ncbi:glycoside hydrolase family 88 protein [Gaetbulibacter aquiaggeris]|uniref:Glycoside hydrolase family 88 protein n=1 Tax=Gaetbulibacter aquiaggeris TaxID=1735373 RepID=A0ABW7ML06_9FLAO
MSKVNFLVLFSVFLLTCYSFNSKVDTEFVQRQLKLAEKQLTLLLTESEKVKRIPRTITTEGKMHWTDQNFDWTEGFFPGACWYLYDFSKDEAWKEAAERFQSQFESHKNYTNNHDLGFVFNSSYGNGYRLTGNESFKQVMITAGDSLITRFNRNVGCIQSWETDTGWQAERGWKFPVIIDNMMNLELLFELSKITGDNKYKNVAIAHANATMKNHFRQDYSSYHLVDYDPETGKVRSKQTAQGYSDESSWARGQAWGLYGYTVCYRYTKDQSYLQQAENIAKYIIENPSIPKDGIPYWDYNAENIPNEPRDVSAAAITASALIELDNYSKNSYSQFIDIILTALASDDYTATIGDNNNFILKHSVGSIPHNAEIDVPLIYADYYYLEALLRKLKIFKDGDHN